MKSDDITKLGLLVAKMKGEDSNGKHITMQTGFDGAVIFFYYERPNNPRAVKFSKQDLEYLAEQNEEAKFLITKLILNGDLP